MCMRSWSESPFVLRRYKKTIAICTKYPEILNLKLIARLKDLSSKMGCRADYTEKKKCLLTFEISKCKTKFEIPILIDTYRKNLQKITCQF